MEASEIDAVNLGAREVGLSLASERGEQVGTRGARGAERDFARSGAVEKIGEIGRRGGKPGEIDARERDVRVVGGRGLQIGVERAGERAAV